MTELPQPDVMDRAGRMRRTVLALVVGVVAASIAFLICNHLAGPDEQVRDSVYTSTHIANAYKFVYFTTALVGASAFSITLAIGNHLANKKWRRELVPPAKQVS